MRSPRIAAFLALSAVFAVLALQRVGVAQAPSNLRIVAPENGQKLSTNFVQVRFELMNTSAAGSPTPTFQLQLDGGDPIHTASTDYTFTGLTPGKHVIVVQLVDANNTPVSGSVNAVQFVVSPPPQPRGALEGGTEQAQLTQIALQQKEQAHKSGLPDAGSVLPLLSVIGFGVLLGGIVSALKTR